VYWESPDVWVQNPSGVIDQPVVGAANTVFANVYNFGSLDATGVFVDFYWVNPSLGISPATANFIGQATVNVITAGSASGPVACPTSWIPVEQNGGHECILAEAYVPGMDPLTSPMNPVLDRHVGQKNEQLVLQPAGEDIRLDLEAVNGAGIAQAIMIEVQPVIQTAIPSIFLTHLDPIRQSAQPPSAAAPVLLHIEDSALYFTSPSPVFAQQLLSNTLRQIAGILPEPSLPALISTSVFLQPWEVRRVQVRVSIPYGARPGQTFGFRITQKAASLVMGGYTVWILVVAPKRK
jgi:hypothetical protein